MWRKNISVLLRASARVSTLPPLSSSVFSPVAALTPFNICNPFIKIGSEQRCVASLHLREYCSAPAPKAKAEYEVKSNEAVTERRETQLGPTKPGAKPRIVVLGSGWAACRLMKEINTEIYDVVCISARNHMVFTPLLASTCVGTLEFRSVAEPLRSIQPALANAPSSYAFLAHCKSIDTLNHEVHCEAIAEEGLKSEVQKWPFRVSYDKLVIATGAQALTFGINGVEENAIFLREVAHARDIRSRLLYNLTASDIPGVTEEERSRLLHCVVVGGGPTGVEFSGELSDFIRRDVYFKYPHVKNYIHVSLIEANEILSSFDARLRDYAVRHLTKTGVRLVQGVVKDVECGKLVLSDGSVVPYGLLVWSTGVGPSKFVKSLHLQKSPGGRIGVDEWLQVPGVEDVYAIGDCAGYLPQTGKKVLPALAQVAERQGKYLANVLNALGKSGAGRAGSTSEALKGDPFEYHHLGSMASVGRFKALVDLRENKDTAGF